MERRCHLYSILSFQDTAKSVTNPRTRTSLIDLNRAGTGLLEIVTEPDLRTPEQAAEYVRSLQELLRAVGVSDGNMDAVSRHVLCRFRCPHFLSRRVYYDVM